MIFKEVTPSKQMALRGWNCTTLAKVVNTPKKETLVDFCVCDYGGCEYEEFAFAYPTDETDEYRNDYRAFLITLLDETSTYEFALIGSNGVEIPLVDDTYGELFDKGFNPLQPLKVGFVLDWLKVYNLLGGDVYKIKVSQVDFGNTVSVESHNFRLMSYSDLASQGTVKIETTQKGEFLNGEDYNGLEWVNMIRLVAQFGNEEKQTEIDRLKDATYTDYDVQTSGFYQYTLTTQLLPSFIADRVLDSDLMTDEIRISNYDVFAYRQYRKKGVVFNGDLEASNDYIKNDKKPFIIKFNDNQTNIKRNFV